MKSKITSPLLTSFLLAAALPLHAGERTQTFIFCADEQPGHQAMPPEPPGGNLAKEPVTFLGVETMPVSRTLAAQLGLADDTGLVVTRILEGSPAAVALQRHDIITKFDNQVLVDMHQLRVLVRSRKEGDEVLLTYYRGGKENSVKVKLGKRDMPNMVGMEGFGPEGMEGPADLRVLDDDLPEIMDLHKLPGMDREDVHDVLRMIGRERGNWLGGPHVQFFSHTGGKGSTILNLADGNFAFSDEAGSVEVTASKGQRELTVKNAKGEVTFKGPINSDEDRRKLPPEVLARLDKIEKVNVSFEPGADFQQDTAVEPPQKSKISQSGLPQEPAPSSRPF